MQVGPIDVVELDGAPRQDPDPWFVRDTMPQQPVPESAWRGWRKAVWGRLQATFSVRDGLVALGLVLLGRGCHMVYAPAGWAVPGLVLLWYALPQRPRFLEPKPRRGPLIEIGKPEPAMGPVMRRGPDGRA